MSPRRIHRGQPASGQSIVGAMCSPAEPPNLLPNFRPAIWFQYKKARSVALQTTQDRSKWAATFLAEFHEDMRALGLEPPIQPDKVEISWRAAQIRAVYSVRHRSSCDIIKNFVIRMVTLEHFKQMCAERFIARVLYVEGSTVVASDAVAAPSNPHIVLGRVPKPQTCSQAPQDGSNVGIRTMAQVSPFLFNDAVSVTENKAPSSCSTSAKHDQKEFTRRPSQVHAETPQQRGRNIKSQTWPAAAQQEHRRAIDMIQLTPSACTRLRDSNDADILASQPVVRVLVVETVAPADGAAPNGVQMRVFVTDGKDYTFLALSPAVVNKIGDGDRQLHCGSAVQLTAMSRLPADGPLGPVRVDDLKPVFDTEADDDRHDPDAPPLLVDIPEDADPQAKLCARTIERDNERRRRILLEQLLAQVCRDLAACTQSPHAMQAMLALADFADLVARD